MLTLARISQMLLTASPRFSAITDSAYAPKTATKAHPNRGIMFPMVFNSIGIAACLLLAAMPVFCQQPWPKVGALKPGDHITVWEKGGTKYKGEMVNVLHEQFSLATADSLHFNSGQRKIDLAQEKIAKIQNRSKSHRLRNMLIGAGIG